MQPNVPMPPVETMTDSVPEGKRIDFLTGRQVNDTPEEYVRQNLERALVRQYGYSKEQCAPEARIRVGSSWKRVDVAVWPADQEHTQENVYILVECKKQGTSPTARVDGVDQLKSYMAACLNARFGLWTNGDDRFCFARRATAKGMYSFEEIVEIPAEGQTEEEAQRPRRKDLVPATADNLLFAFRRCHNYISAYEGMQKPEAFWELLKIIFCKIEDERSPLLSFYVLPAELENATTAAPAKARMAKLFRDKVVNKYPTIFRTPDTQAIDLKAMTIAYLVSQLQKFSLLATNVDVKGKAYEEVVGSNLRGDRGEFFTPRNACQMAVQMIDPRPGERILDPACGTGGFLITAMNHALTLLDADERSQWSDPAVGTEPERQELWRKRSEYLQECIAGLDLNPSLVRAAKMNMVMNNDGSGNLEQANSLANPHTWSQEARKVAMLGEFDIVFTNPPFGVNIIIDDTEILSQFDLAAVWNFKDSTWEKRLDKGGNVALQSSQPPEILFIERCVQFLKPGTGRMAMVVPNGILNNPAYAYIRQWIMANTQVLAVIDMARDLFQPRNDTQTSMVLMRRLSPQEQELASSGRMSYECFMAVTERIGHDKRGKTIYRRNEKGEDILVEHEEYADASVLESPTHMPSITVLDRLIDDELPEAAAAYRAWVRQVAAR